MVDPQDPVVIKYKLVNKIITSLWFLNPFFLPIPSGGQMVVTDMTGSEKRADALGKLGVSYGIGMVVGPFVGGIVNTRLG